MEKTVPTLRRPEDEVSRQVQAFHSFWTKPNRIRTDGSVRVPDAELLVLMLSALKWKQLNGPIKMITDSYGREFFESLGLANLWSEPINAGLDVIDKRVDAFLFWAAGKLYALAQMPAPCVMLDTDLIIWEDINWRFGNEVITAHSEELNEAVYPDPHSFPVSSGYRFPSEWDFSISPANTAFLYMPDADLKKYYTDSAIEFVDALLPSDAGPVVTMCFAEQRVLPMCCAAKGVGLSYLLDWWDLPNQRLATHIWGYKSVLRDSEEERRSFCKRCARRIVSDFPEWADTMAANPQLCTYLPI